MAMGRLGLKNIMRERVVISSPWVPILRTMISSDVPAAGVGEKSEGGGEVVVSKGDNKLGLFPKRRRPTGFWTTNHRDPHDFTPADIYLLFPSGLGDALMQSSKNINRVIENLPPSELIGRVKEENDRYKIQYELPRGVSKEDVMIMVDQDCILTVKAEHKKEEKEGGGGCSATLLMPEDAKVDEIRAQMENGVLVINIPRTG